MGGKGAAPKGAAPGRGELPSVGDADAGVAVGAAVEVDPVAARGDASLLALRPIRIDGELPVRGPGIGGVVEDVGFRLGEGELAAIPAVAAVRHLELLDPPDEGRAHPDALLEDRNPAVGDRVRIVRVVAAVE